MVQVHVAGTGDFFMDNITALPDPCPLPKKDGEKRKKHLTEKDTLLYAPMSR